MKDELISFKTAVLAKEKGFNIPCNTHCFIENTDKIVFETSIYCIDWGNRPHLKTVQKYSAPTQSLLQRWLRENHNFNPCVITTSTNGEIKGWHQHNHLISMDNLYLVDKTVYKSYEEALEVSLVKALKLIV